MCSIFFRHFFQTKMIQTSKVETYLLGLFFVGEFRRKISFLLSNISPSYRISSDSSSSLSICIEFACDFGSLMIKIKFWQYRYVQTQKLEIIQVFAHINPSPPCGPKVFMCGKNAKNSKIWRRLVEFTGKNGKKSQNPKILTFNPPPGRSLSIPLSRNCLPPMNTLHTWWICYNIHILT